MVGKQPAGSLSPQEKKEAAKAKNAAKSFKSKWV
jgi:hypothetical protein